MRVIVNFVRLLVVTLYYSNTFCAECDYRLSNTVIASTSCVLSDVTFIENFVIKIFNE